MTSLNFTGITETDRVPRVTETGHVPVDVQDQTTAPNPAYFLQSITGGEFTVAVATGESGEDVGSFVYDVTISSGHTVVTNDHIVLLDTAADRFLFAKVLNVVGDVLTLDRMIDHNFPVGALGRRVINNMAVDGSTTAQVFTFRAGTVPSDQLGFCINIICTLSPDDSKFGDLSALTRGVAFRVLDGYHRTIGVIKTNEELTRFGATVEYTDRAGAGNYGVKICLPFRNLWGVALRLEGTGQLQVVVQDDLTGLVGMYAGVYGHLTQGEV